MSIQWTIAASFLYIEIGIVTLLVLPVASAKTWQRLFRSRFLQVLGNQGFFYFCTILFVLVLFLMDAIREMRKHSNIISTMHSADKTLQIGAEVQENMKLFRAQRNFYISGFALFLSFVIRRLVLLISSLATQEAKNEALFKQAQNATTMAKSMMKGEGISGENQKEVSSSEVEKLKLKLSEVEKELERERSDKEAMKKQAESLNKEYDRLSDEFIKLEKKGTVESAGDKKSK